MRRHCAMLLATLLSVSACGDTRLERTGSGAAIGGGIGVASGFLCCDAGKGAQSGLFIGMAVGALIGFLVEHPLFFNYHDD
ncbi:MAG: hypothetical protein V4735_09040 [Pseudomonadota bacterium]